MNVHDWASKWYFIAVCAVGYLLTASLSCAAEPKFGMVDMRTVFQTSKRTQQAEANVRKAEQETASKASLINAAKMALEQKLEKEKDTLSDAQKSDLQTQIKMKREELELEKQAGQFKVKLTTQSAQKTLVAQIDALVAKIAQEEGLTAVFHRGSMVYSKGMVDITEKLVKALDELAAEDPKPTAQPGTPQQPKANDKK
ncbi:MAG: OmpH family outer membrane protein [Thermodesulfobacteriota bacterium]